MASTYTTNLGIEKPAAGEQDGTWGGTLNTDFELFDEAISGIISVTLAAVGTTGSPNTLAVTNGASSDGRNKYITFVDGGDLGGTAHVQLTPNDSERVVYIKNSLSGSRSIILFQGTYDAGRDYVLANGETKIITFSGGGASASTAATLDVTGDHGDLSGLSDDDHTQYLLADGSRGLSGNWDAGSFKITAETFTSDVATGTAPFTVSSTTLVANLNADTVDGVEAAAFGLLANPLSQFANTTSLQLKDMITNETGSGALVFATSPTFVTPVLGTPSSGVATNLTGTAAGLTAGNVSTNANLTGHITSTGNAAILGSFSAAQLSTALSDVSFSGTNTGDEPDTSLTVKGIIELATQTEVDAGTDAVKAVTPDTLSNFSGLGSGGGGITWLLKTTNYTLVANDGILSNGSSLTMTLPASLTVGDPFIVSNLHSSTLTIADNGHAIRYKGTSYTNNVTLAQGETIHLVAATTGIVEII